LATGPIAAANAGPVAAPDPAGAIAAAANLTGERGHATGASRAIATADPTGPIAAAANLAGKRRHAARAGGAIPAADPAGPIGTDSAARLRKGRLCRDPTEARPITAAADLAREGRSSTRATRPVSTTDPARAVTAANLAWQRCGAAGASPTTESAGTIPTSPRADLPRKRRRPAEPTGSAADLARQSGRAATKTVGPIEPAEISGLRGRPRHPGAADASHAGPADAATELARLRRRPVGGAWE
jgi:hypothetical protein